MLKVIEEETWVQWQEETNISVVMKKWTQNVRKDAFCLNTWDRVSWYLEVEGGFENLRSDLEVS